LSKRSTESSRLLIIVKKQVTISSSALSACKSAEAVVIATEWEEFKKISWQEVYDNMSKPAFLFDGRLIVDEAALRKIGFKVWSLLSYVLLDIKHGFI
jgi:UDPglucose 6-dehydrogenase